MSLNQISMHAHTDILTKLLYTLFIKSLQVRLSMHADTVVTVKKSLLNYWYFIR